MDTRQFASARACAQFSLLLARTRRLPLAEGRGWISQNVMG